MHKPLLERLYGLVNIAIGVYSLKWSVVDFQLIYSLWDQVLIGTRTFYYTIALLCVILSSSALIVGGALLFMNRIKGKYMVLFCLPILIVCCYACYSLLDNPPAKMVTEMLVMAVILVIMLWSMIPPPSLRSVGSRKR